jgi:coenzyme F420 hydrogenase subunit beta
LNETNNSETYHTLGVFDVNAEAPYRAMCTDCGVSRSAEPGRCGRACQFIKPDYPARERSAHGRARESHRAGEDFFGVVQAMYRARLRHPAAGAQWTGITTRLAQVLLEQQQVEGVLTMVPDTNDRWKPVPALITRGEDLELARGMRMGYAPLLALLDTVRQKNIRRLAVIGIPCQVYALRALQSESALDSLYVIGTPCSDNTTTANFHRFLSLLDPNPDTISYLEFRADYHVELRFDDGRRETIPFLKLPLTKLPSDFFPLTCRTCVDYTNALADITVGYMGGEGDQWLIVRNERGAELLSLIESELILEKPGSAGKRDGAVKGFQTNVERAAGGLPLRSMPDWLRPVMAWLMPRIGPRGMEFARARVEMKAIETILHLRREKPRQLKSMVPDHVWRLVERYGLTPGPDEVRRRDSERE